MTSSVAIDVAEAIAKYKQGSTKDYDILISQLVSTDLQTATLAAYLKGLKRCAAALDRDFDVLAGVILRLDWAGCGDASVVKEYQAFILNLVSGHTFYLRACLRMAVKLLQPKMDSSEVTEEMRRKDEQVFVHVHSLLKAILHTVPMTPRLLLPLLRDAAPYLTRPGYVQQCYATNLLHLSSYLPGQRAAILEVIIDNMLKLDVRSPRHEIEAAEDDDVKGDSDDDITDDIFLMDEDAEKRLEMKHPQADRLDMLMCVFFNFTRQVCYKDGELDWTETRTLYRELLLVFERIVLPTHASCHVQFLLFYICSFKEALCEGFLDYLWKKMQNPNTDTVFRQVSVAYIASLLARAKYINVSTVKACLDLMVAWVHRYIAEATHTAAKCQLGRHAAFYSVCQAIFYVIIFRHKELLAMDKGYKYLQSLNLQTMVTSRLNPLRMCLPLIAKTFASITRMHQLVFCDTVLEHNRRTMLVTVNNDQTSTSDGVLNPLEAFFPFDPYLLQRSAGFLTSLYQEYEGAAVQPADTANSEPEEIEQYLDSGGTSFEAVRSDDIDMSAIRDKMTSPTDLLMYGTSPGFQHNQHDVSCSNSQK